MNALPTIHLRRARGDKKTHLFVEGRTASLCLNWSVEHEMLDPRARREPRIVYCGECFSKLAVRGETLR